MGQLIQQATDQGHVAGSSVEENTLTAYFTQKMFTVSVVQPQTPSEMFSDDFTEQRLQEQVRLGRIGQDNLPTYISSVVYGRMLMLTVTSTSSIEDIRAALQATREGIGGGSVESHHLDLLEFSQLKVTTVGGVDEQDVTGARYRIKIDKYVVTDYGCDLYPGVEPEVAAASD